MQREWELIRKRRVVITGTGVISPIGNGSGRFFEALTEGKCGIRGITRFDTSDFKVKVAAEVDFDPADYGMTKDDLRRNDLYCLYGLAAASEAVESSGILGTVDPERLGVYVGSGIGGMTTFIDETLKLDKGGPRKVSPMFVQKIISNIAAGNIAIKYGAHGPCLPVVTACATSTNDIGEAYRAIAFGYADAIIAGGCEATITRLGVAGFQNCLALTKSENPLASSLPFDRRRDGFVMGEGAAILVLEEYERAMERGANILCEIAGYANTCDGYHVTAPDPTGAQAARAYREAAEQAGYNGSEPLYINAHGTGTPLNDASESAAIKQAFGVNAYKAAISSTKSMTGHMLGAAGAAEAVCCAYALKNGILPPTIGLSEPDPDCDLDYIPQKARRVQAELALSASLGFGGHNGCLAFRRV